jgi:hypothetical protein
VLLDKPNASDIDLQVSFFAVEGKADMGGGLIWRASAIRFAFALWKDLEKSVRAS